MSRARFITLAVRLTAWLTAVVAVAEAGHPGLVASAGGPVGVLVGRVTMGPMSPVGRSGDPGSVATMPGVRVTITGVEGQEIKSVVTDQDGGYRVQLPPGSYRVVMPPLPSGRFTKDLPRTVTITAGQETRVDIRVDSGIR